MNYYFNNAMRLEGDLMSRGKEVKELREKMGMNRREFSDYYGIPYRTVQDWEERTSGVSFTFDEISGGSGIYDEK